jgi:predicted acetyltransferase
VRALVGFLAAQGEQIERVELFVPRGHASPLLVEHALSELEPGMRAHVGAYTATAAMGRLVDVAAAFAAHPGPARARLGAAHLALELSDPVFADQTGVFDVVFGARGARMTAGGKAQSRGTPRLTLDVARLAQIYFAAAPATQLFEQGLVAGDRVAAELLDAVFAGPPLFLSPGNFF